MTGDVKTDPNTQSWQKILPHQDYNALLYRRSGVPLEQALYDLVLDISGMKEPTKEFDLECSEMFTVEQMASSAVSLRLLQWLIGLAGCRTVLEIGTFVGVSALYFAKAMPDDGLVVTIEKFDHFAAIAQRNFDNNGLAHKIKLVIGDAAEVLPSLATQHRFDLVFVDGNKERYRDYLRMVRDSVSPGGVIVIDDALFHGEILNETGETPKGKGVQASLDEAKAMAGWDRVFVPISNGMLFLRKPR